MSLFIQKGFSNTTLNEIAQQINVTRGAIYWHYPDKLHIINELIETEHENLSALFNELFVEEVSTFSQIENILESIVAYFFDNKSFRDFIELTWFKIEYTQLSNISIRKTEMTSEFINQFTRIVDQAQKLGLVRGDVMAKEVAITCVNMINGLYRLYFIVPDQINNKQQATDSFINYLQLIKCD